MEESLCGGWIREGGSWEEEWPWKRAGVEVKEGGRNIDREWETRGRTLVRCCGIGERRGVGPLQEFGKGNREVAGC